MQYRRWERAVRWARWRPVIVMVAVVVVGLLGLVFLGMKLEREGRESQVLIDSMFPDMSKADARRVNKLQGKIKAEQARRRKLAPKGAHETLEVPRAATAVVQLGGGWVEFSYKGGRFLFAACRFHDQGYMALTRIGDAPAPAQ